MDEQKENVIEESSDEQVSSEEVQEVEEIKEEVADDSYHRENEYDALARRFDEVMEKLDAIAEAVKGAFSVAVENGAVISDEEVVEEVIEEEALLDAIEELDLSL